MSIQNHHCPGRNGSRGGPALCSRRDDKSHVLKGGTKVRYCAKHQVICPIHESIFVKTTDLRIRCKQECRGCKVAKEEEWKKARNEIVEKALSGQKDEAEAAVEVKRDDRGHKKQRSEDYWYGMSSEVDADLDGQQGGDRAEKSDDGKCNTIFEKASMLTGIDFFI